MEANYNPFSFMSTDIVVWNDIICTFGSIAFFTRDGDRLRLANKEEELLHKKVN